MKARKRKPLKIPNAPEIARAMDEKLADRLADGRVDRAVERGRTIGRLETLARILLYGSTNPKEITLFASDCALMEPVLRAEVDRLKAVRP